MTSFWFFTMLQISIIACAVVAGVFLTFSDFVMRSLDGARQTAGIEVMQIINREVFPTVFMFLLLGWSALSPLLIAFAYFNLAGFVSQVIMAGGTLFFVGVFGVSMVFNVPMNERLAMLEFTGPAAAKYWSGTYLPRWTFWNYVRSVCSGLAAICFLLASIMLSQTL